MEKILFVILAMFLLQGCGKNVEPHTLTYCTHYPSRVDTVTVKCHSYRYRSLRGSSYILYCQNMEPHCFCNEYYEIFETSAPIEIISFK